MTATGARPRTRPRDRKESIIDAASGLFARSGFHNVSTAEIAAAVGVTPGALYRHFPSKRELLARTIIERFERADAALATDAVPDLDALATRLAAILAGRRELGVLWSRESRHLADEHRALIRESFRATLSRLALSVAEFRPDLGPEDAELVSLCTLGAITSVGYHGTAASPERLERLLHDLALRALTTPPPRASSSGSIESDPASTSRREALIAAAARLVSGRGYQSVSMEDIGAAVGVTSASVYRYFSSKSDLLASLVGRATQALHAGMSSAGATRGGPRAVLEGALRQHVRFALDQHELLGVLVSEIDNLPGEIGRTLRREQRAYLEGWFRLLAAARPELDRVDVRFRVHAALTLVNETVRTHHVRTRAGTAEWVEAVARDVLLLG